MDPNIAHRLDDLEYRVQQLTRELRDYNGHIESRIDDLERRSLTWTIWITGSAHWNQAFGIWTVGFIILNPDCDRPSPSPAQACPADSTARPMTIRCPTVGLDDQGACQCRARPWPSAAVTRACSGLPGRQRHSLHTHSAAYILGN
jgi:hypothetical protein